MARVLVIEPDPRIQVFITGILADFGHDVQQCASARELGCYLTTSAFDVLVTDIILDDVDGEAEALVSLLPITTLTGESYDAVAAGQSLPLRDRPFRFDDLRRLVAAVGRRGAERCAVAA
jgi:two-component system nitrogen regulation response regulator GlnG